MEPTIADAETPSFNPYTGKARRWEKSIVLGKTFSDTQRHTIEDTLDFFESHRAGKRLLKAIAKHYKQAPLEIQPTSAKVTDNPDGISNHYDPHEKRVYLAGDDEYATYFDKNGDGVNNNDRALIAHELRHSVNAKRQQVVKVAIEKYKDLHLEELQRNYESVLVLQQQSSLKLAPEVIREAKDEYVKVLKEYEPYRQSVLKVAHDDEVRSMKEEIPFLEGGKNRASYLMTSGDPEMKALTVGEFHEIYERTRESLHDPMGKGRHGFKILSHAEDALAALAKIAKQHGIAVTQEQNYVTTFSDPEIRHVFREANLTVPTPQDTNLTDMSDLYYKARMALKNTGATIEVEGEKIPQISHGLQSTSLVDKLPALDASLNARIEHDATQPTNAPHPPVQKSGKSTEHSH